MMEVCSGNSVSRVKSVCISRTGVSCGYTFSNFKPFDSVVFAARVILDRDSGRSRGFGFVTYTSTDAASSAIQAFDGQVQFFLAYLHLLIDNLRYTLHMHLGQKTVAKISAWIYFFGENFLGKRH